MKPLIICVVGESGTGKTTAVEHAEKTLGVKMIESYTDRAPRFEGEPGHTFVSQEEFAKLKREDMIAYTDFGKYRYCCLKEDILPINFYVIDEFGVKYLKENFSEDYIIKTIRIVRPLEERKKIVSEERLARDEGMFTAPLEEYDEVIQSGEIEAFKKEFLRVADKLIVYHLSINNHELVVE